VTAPLDVVVVLCVVVLVVRAVVGVLVVRAVVVVVLTMVLVVLAVVAASFQPPLSISSLRIKTQMNSQACKHCEYQSFE
jgi:uncharacterized membrane protein